MDGVLWPCSYVICTLTTYECPVDDLYVRGKRVNSGCTTTLIYVLLLFPALSLPSGSITGTTKKSMTQHKMLKGHSNGSSKNEEIIKVQ